MGRHISLLRGGQLPVVSKYSSLESGQQEILPDRDAFSTPQQELNDVVRTKSEVRYLNS